MENRTERHVNYRQLARTLTILAAVSMFWLSGCGAAAIKAESGTNPAPPSSATLPTEEVLVRQGDSYSSIDNRCEVPYWEIQELNLNADLFAGGVIDVPEPNSCEGADEIRDKMERDCNFTTVSVQYGDNLDSVASDNGADVSLLGLANGLSSNSSLVQGTTLEVPVGCDIAK